MPVSVEQHSSETGKLENSTVKDLPGVRQGVFLPPSVWAGKEILQPRLRKPGQEEGGEQE